jgi:hypothetical protein
METQKAPKYPKKTAPLMQSKYIRPEMKILDAENGRIHAIVSTETRDRDGDIIRASGWELDRFKEHPVLVSSHNYGRLDSIIGEWEEISVNGNQLEGIAKYYIGQGNSEADWGFNLAMKGRAAYSVGFIPDMSEAKEIAGSTRGFSGWEYNKQELLEVSHVTIPSNPDALQQIKSLATHPIVKEIIEEELGDMRNEEVISDEWIARMAEKLGPLLAEIIMIQFKEGYMIEVLEPTPLKMQGDDDDESDDSEDSDDDDNGGEEVEAETELVVAESLLAHVDSIIEHALRQEA